jgi:hypothetical protein
MEDSKSFDTKSKQGRELGGSGVLSQKTWRDGGAKILKEAFLKMLLKGFDLDFTPKKIEKDLFDVHFS